MRPAARHRERTAISAGTTSDGEIGAPLTIDGAWPSAALNVVWIVIGGVALLRRPRSPLEGRDPS